MRLFYVLPPSAIENVVNSPAPNSVLFANLARPSTGQWRFTFSAGLYFTNITTRQHGKWCGVPCATGALWNLVVNILLACSPLKIFQSIIRWVAVGKVTTLHSWGWGSNERTKHENVYQFGFVAFCHNIEMSRRFFHGTELMPTVSHNGFFVSCSSAPTRPYSSIVPDSVAGKSGAVSILNYRTARIDFGHDSLLQAGCVELAVLVTQPTPVFYPSLAGGQQK